MQTTFRTLTLALAVFCSPAAQAGTSAMTDAFAASTSRAYAILQQSDNLALNNGGRPGLQTFARRDLACQAPAAEALVAWAHAEQRAAKRAAETPSLDALGPVLYPFDAVVLPLSIDGRAATAADRALLEQMAALHGSAFDDLYASSQITALNRLQETYVDYIKNGDDPALRLLAVRNLPKVRQLIADLRRL